MPNTKSDSPYIFSTDEQLRQDLKKVMAERGFTASKLDRALNLPAQTISRFLNGRVKKARDNASKYVTWLNEQDATFYKTPLAVWLTLQTCLIDIAGRTGELSPDALAAISELNDFFSSAK